MLQLKEKDPETLEIEITNATFISLKKECQVGSSCKSKLSKLLEEMKDCQTTMKYRLKKNEDFKEPLEELESHVKTLAEFLEGLRDALMGFASYTPKDECQQELANLKKMNAEGAAHDKAVRSLLKDWKALLQQ